MIKGAPPPAAIAFLNAISLGENKRVSAGDFLRIASGTTMYGNTVMSDKYLQTR
jgi:hypothetical protein